MTVFRVGKDGGAQGGSVKVVGGRRCPVVLESKQRGLCAMSRLIVKNLPNGVSAEAGVGNLK